jgi:hypothetical protein
MEEKNQQDRFLGVDREWGDDPEGRVKVEKASQEYEFSPTRTFTFDPSLRTSRIRRVVLYFPIIFFPFRLFTGELVLCYRGGRGRNSNGAQAVQWGNV